MDLGRVLLAGTFNFSLALFAGLFGLTQTVGQPLGFDPFRESFWRNLFVASTPLEEFVSRTAWLPSLAGIALLLLLGLVTGSSARCSAIMASGSTAPARACGGDEAC